MFFFLVSIEHLIYFKVFGKIRVVRDCGYITSDDDNKGCVRKTGTYEVQNFFCSCTDDLCNTASTLQWTSLWIVSSICALLLITRFQ